MFDHGHKVESRGLRRRLAASEGLVREANNAIQTLERRVLATERALIAAARDLPADEPATPGRPATLYLPPVAAAGTEIIGITAVTERTSSKAVLLSDRDQFAGVPEVLIPGAFWSYIADTAVIEIEAFVSPAYVMKYNEIVIPFISAAEQTVRLHHSSGFHAYSGARTTRCVRHRNAREWNGRITIQSHASYRVDGKYVHAGVAPYIYLSSWIDSGRVAAQRELALAGTFTPRQILAGSTALANPTFTLNGTPFTGSTAVAAGDVLGIEADLLWEVAASSLALTYDLTV